MRRVGAIAFILGAGAVLSAVALQLYAQDRGPAEAIPGWPDSTPGVIDSISIDGYTEGNSPNGPINPVVPCASICVNGVQDCDEDGVDSAELDIVIDEVDPADLMTGFEVELAYNYTVITITSVETAGEMISVNPGSVHVPGSDPVPDADGVFKIAADDVGPVPSSSEEGEGVLATIEITATAPSPGVSTLIINAATVLDRNGEPIPVTQLGGAMVEVNSGGCSYIDVAIMEETVSGPVEIGPGGGDFLIEKIARNDSMTPMDGEITTEIMPPPECDVGSGLGNLHTIVSDLPAMPVGVDTDVDVPFSVQCSLPGAYDSDFQISNEIDVVGAYLMDMNSVNNAVHHDQLPGAPPSLTLSPYESPGPALRVHVMNCAPVPPWPVPAGDSDCDGFTDADEGAITTDASDDCPDNATDDAWPCDFDMNAVINISDVFNLLPPVFGSSAGGADYSERRDLVPDGVINISDVFKVLPPYFGSSCGP